MVNIGNEWDELLADQFRSEYYKKLRAFLVDEYNRYNVYPPADCIFNALKYTPYSKVKAVLLGQDPYHGPGQTLLFGKAWSYAAPVAEKYLYRDTQRPWHRL